MAKIRLYKLFIIIVIDTLKKLVLIWFLAFGFDKKLIKKLIKLRSKKHEPCIKITTRNPNFTGKYS